jgi:hypothetical protein
VISQSARTFGRLQSILASRTMEILVALEPHMSAFRSGLSPNNRFQGRPPLRGVRPEPKR